MNKSSKKSTFVSSAMFMAGIGILIKIMGGIYKVILGRETFYGQAGGNIVSFVNPYYNLLLVLSTVGLSSAVAKIISAHDVKGEMQEKENVFRLVKIVMLVLGAILSIFLFAFAPIICNSSEFSEAVHSMRALSFAVVIVSVMSAYRGYFQGHQDLKPFANSQLMEQFVKVTLGILFAALLLPIGVEYSAAGSLYGVSIGALVGLIYLMYKKRVFDKTHNLPKAQRLSYQESKAIIGKILYYAIPIAVGASMFPVMGLIDGRMIKPALIELGYSKSAASDYYGYLAYQSKALIGFPAILFQAVRVSILPAVAVLVAVKNHKKLLHTVKTGLKVNFIIALPSAVGMYVLASPILYLLWNNLESSKSIEPILRLMSISLIFVATYQCTSSILQGMGKQIINTFNLFIGVIVKFIVLCCLLKVSSMAIYAGAISTILAFLTTSVLNILVLKRNIEGSIIDFKSLLKLTVSALVMGGIVWFSYELLFGLIASNTIATLISVMLGAASYGILLIYLKVLNEDDLQFMPGKKYLKRFVK